MIVISGCSSKPPAPQCVPAPVPAPPAWLMQAPPNSQQTLDRIISPSGISSPSARK
uniref:lysis system o-spanin lipoprotein Rz1 n=1 Tax=Pseudomonas machongensis TaxID=3110229 RepID=UPI00389AC7E7